MFTKTNKTSYLTFADNKMQARIREELDQANNMKKEDRIIMMGLKSNVPVPATESERKVWAKATAIEAIKLFDRSPRPGSAILYAKVGTRSGDMNLPPIEIKFNSRETALHLFPVTRRSTPYTLS